MCLRTHPCWGTFPHFHCSNAFGAAAAAYCRHAYNVLIFHCLLPGLKQPTWTPPLPHLISAKRQEIIEPAATRRNSVSLRAWAMCAALIERGILQAQMVRLTGHRHACVVRPYIRTDSLLADVLIDRETVVTCDRPRTGPTDRQASNRIRGLIYCLSEASC